MKAHSTHASGLMNYYSKYYLLFYFIIRNAADIFLFLIIMLFCIIVKWRAPELFEVPSHCEIDEKTDIWSLGCTLYAMAYGRQSFETIRMLVVVPLDIQKIQSLDEVANLIVVLFRYHRIPWVPEVHGRWGYEGEMSIGGRPLESRVAPVAVGQLAYIVFQY